MLLDHFDGTTTATISGATTASGCGSQWTAATPISSYISGQNGLGQALTMSPPAGAVGSSISFLKYPTQDILSLPNGTIEFWVYPTGYQTSLADQGQYYNACYGWTFHISIDANGYLTSSDWASSNSFSMTSNTTVPLNTWSHVAVSWGSTGAKMYLNGVLVGSNAATSYPAGGYGGYLLVPSGTQGGAGCIIDELRISNIQRTSFNLCKTIAPAAPVLTSPANGANNQSLSLSLNWSSSAGSTSYEAEVSLSSSFGTTLFDQSSTTSTTAAVSGLSNNVTYYWRANALNIGGMTWSNTWSFTTIIAAPGLIVLSSPTNNAGNLPTALSCSWSTVSSAASYALRVSTVSSFLTTVTAQNSLSTGNGQINGLANNTRYYWMVNATNAGGTSAWSSMWSFTTIPLAPGVPLLSSPTNGALNQSAAPTFSWGSVSGATSYSFQLSTVSSFSPNILSGTNLQSTSIAASGLANLSKYYWRVNAANAGGTSSWSSVWSFTVNLTSVVSSDRITIEPSFSIKNGILSYTLSQQGPVAIRIYDILGKKIFELNRIQSSGNYSFSVKNRHLSPELYIVHFKAGTLERQRVVIGK